ncbi:hypothetical protein D3C86_1313060 [compost metagenome]
MGLNRKALHTDGLIQEIIYCIPGNAILPAIGRKGLQPQLFTFQFFNRSPFIFNEDILIINVVKRQQLAQGTCKPHAEFGSVRAELVISDPATA